MFPLLVVSQTPKYFEDFFAEYREKNKIKNSQLFTIEPVKTELAIAQVRDLKRSLLTSSGITRYLIIKCLDTASAEVQNALLKTFEEKTSNNQFIMPITSLSPILPTIQSRCQVIVLSKNFPITIRPQTEALLEKIRFANNLQFLGEESLQGMNREEASEFLLEVIFYFKLRLAELSAKAAVIIKRAVSLRSLLQSNNLNPALSVDICLLSIYRALH